MSGFDFDALASSLGIEGPRREEETEPEQEQRRSVQILKTMDTQRKMRLLSQEALERMLPWHLEEGCAYHIISAGDVDSLTYLRHIAREQRIRYAIVSTWCMATADADEMREWVERGIVGRFDFYVGEIFKDGYRGCRDKLDEICALCGGRVARFRNHSKVMAVFGEEYDCVIESSANVDTNPRTEQTCITVNPELARFYKEYYDGINDFDGKYKDWKPMEV